MQGIIDDQAQPSPKALHAMQLCWGSKVCLCIAHDSDHHNAGVHTRLVTQFASAWDIDLRDYAGTMLEADQPSLRILASGKCCNEHVCVIHIIGFLCEHLIAVYIL